MKQEQIDALVEHLEMLVRHLKGPENANDFRVVTELAIAMQDAYCTEDDRGAKRDTHPWTLLQGSLVHHARTAFDAIVTVRYDKPPKDPRGRVYVLIER